MKLGALLADCEYRFVGNSGAELRDREITGVAYDSRKVRQGEVFVALKGETSDGHDFIHDSLSRGAAVVVCGHAERVYDEKEVLKTEDNRIRPVFIEVEDSRKALACIANNFFRRPSEELTVIGITGTNGKTTTTYLVKSILEAWEKKPGLIGTINYIIGQSSYPSVHTTPESLDFQALLREMVSAGCTHAVTEVSSHSLSQKRVDFTRFVVVLFTNLTRDHLDYHGNMEEYFHAKKRLFSELLGDSGSALVNIDDPWGKRLVGELAGGDIPADPLDAWISRHALLTFGVKGDADITARNVHISPSGISCTIRYKNFECRVDSPLLGIPNLYNILAAASVGIALGVPPEVVREGIARVDLIKGRLEKVDVGQKFLCIIDYAHTPDALERLIVTAREILGYDEMSKRKKGYNRIITVFGCGGDRDRGKRPIMGDIAARMSDLVILTSDNPRSEDPLAIINEIQSGISQNNCTVIPERKAAIAAAVGMAAAGDIVIIAGKGHEDYQEIGGVRHRFSDREIAEGAISQIQQRDNREA